MRTQSTLSTELQALVPTDNAVLAAQRLAQAYGDYMKDAEANLIPIVAAAVDSTAVPAMAGSMTFSFAAADGAAQILAGVGAFWTAVAAAPATFFPGATIVTPPVFATLAASLVANFASNTLSSNSLIDSVDAVATSLHTATTGATATFPPAAPSAIL